MLGHPETPAAQCPGVPRWIHRRRRHAFGRPDRRLGDTDPAHPAAEADLHALELHVFTDLALVFTVAVVAALALAPLRLPPVLGYLATGVLLGPPVLGFVERGDELAIVAEVGVVLLLFTVGLELSIRELRRSWRAVLVAGGLQVALTVAAVAVAGVALGRTAAVATAWGLLIAPSSTAVVLRLLEGRGEARAAHGRAVLGVLLFQDLAVVPMMLALPTLAGQGGSPLAIAWVLGKAVLIVAFTAGLAIGVVPRAFRLVARHGNREVFLLAVLGVAGITAWVTSMTGLSLALGAFVAGMVLADTEYAHQALADVLPFRTVTMCVFFVGMGMLLDVGVIRAAPAAFAGAALAIVAVKLAVMWATGIALRVPVRVAGLAAIALAQTGEFSFVLSGQAEQLGLLPTDELRLFLAASIATIAATPLLVALFPRLLAGSRPLARLERLLDPAAATPDNADQDAAGLRDHAIVAGLGVAGRAVVAGLESAGVTVVVVELNPETVVAERSRGRRIVYGDVASPEVLAHAGLDRARLVCLVTSDAAANARAVAAIRGARAEVPIVLRTRFAADEGGLRAPGIEVLSEEFAGASVITGAVLQACGIDRWAERVDALRASQRAAPADTETPLGPPPARLGATEPRG